MPLTIIVDDIANFSRPIEAVVNLCHPTPGEVGTGVDAAIHKKAGEKLRARLKELGRLKVGGIHYTDGYGLTNAHGEKVQSIFHVLGPLWHDGKMGEEEQLRRCYLDILQMACKRGVKSIAFPMISAGNRGFPEDVAYRIATDAFRAFFDVPHDPQMQAYLVIFSGKIVEYCRRQQTDIVEVLDSKSVEAVLQEVYTVPVETTYQRMMDSFLRRINLSGRIDQYLAEHPDGTVFQTLTGLMDLQLCEDQKLAEAINETLQWDLVLFLEPDVEFVQDGTRNEEIHANRSLYSQQIKELLTRQGIDFVEINGDHLQRFEKAKQHIDRKLGITTRF